MVVKISYSVTETEHNSKHRHLTVNSLWPNDVPYVLRTRQILVQVKACCQTAPSHHLNLRWLGISDTVGTPYNTNVGVQKIPDRAIWKPVVAKRNNTNPWSCSKPQILVTRDSRQVHMAEQPASRDRLGVNFSLHAFITDCLTTL